MYSSNYFKLETGVKKEISFGHQVKSIVCFWLKTKQNKKLQGEFTFFGWSILEATLLVRVINVEAISWGKGLRLSPGRDLEDMLVELENFCSCSSGVVYE